MIKKMIKKIMVAFYRTCWLYRRLYIKKKCAPFYKYMLDAESKRIMHLRERFSAQSWWDDYKFIREFTKEDMQFRIGLLSGKRVIVCLMDESAVALKRMNYTKILFDHSQWKDSYQCVRLTDDFCVCDEDVIVPVWGRGFDADFLKHKLGKDINLCLPKFNDGVLHGGIGKQYFDVFEPCQDEIVVDCGAFDGKTEQDIAEWTNYNYKKIYAFEPNEANVQKCRLFYRDNELQNIELIPKGTWSKDTVLSFSAGQDENDAGGRITTDGNDESKVFVTSIDNVVGDDKVTFIKMDVEGAELESLKGAAQTIKRDAPKLAICIYHKTEDLWTIPKYILGLNGNYRFYIRHYTSIAWETVLYAVSK